MDRQTFFKGIYLTPFFASRNLDLTPVYFAFLFIRHIRYLPFLSKCCMIELGYENKTTHSKGVHS